MSLNDINISTRKDSIFLHYLDRELLRSIGYDVDLKKANVYTKILLLGCGVTLYANYSVIVEGNYLTDSLHDFIPQAVTNNLIELISEDYSFGEFISSRQIMYSFDRDRYEMYYTNPISLEPYLHANIMCNYDDIDNLTNHLYGWANNNNNFISTLLQKRDFLRLETIRTDIVKALQKREEEALTLSFFEQAFAEHHYSNVLNDYKNPIARLLSALYINDFLIFLDSSIATGIPGISYFDSLQNNFPFNDVPILTKIFEKIGLLDHIINKNSENIISIMMDKNHIAITSVINNIIGTIYFLEKEEGKEKHIIRNRIISQINKLHPPKEIKSNISIEEVVYRLESLRKQLAPSTYPNYIASATNNDIGINLFISHSSDNKADFVNDLVDELNNYGIKTWFDIQQIHVGDSIVDMISNGILKSSSGFIIVLSASYFSKPWCLAELRTLLHISITSGTKLFPIYHRVSHDFVSQRQSLLNDIASLDSSLGHQEIAIKILNSFKALH